MVRGLFHEKMHVVVLNMGLNSMLLATIFAMLHDKDTKYVRIYMKKIINCCLGECYVSCDHVVVRGFKRYAV